MKKSLLFILLLSLINEAHAVDAENRASNVLKFGKWFVAEFTMPTTITYRIGAESNLPEQREMVFIDISPLNQCEPGKVTVNQFIGYAQVDFTNTPFIPVKYKISGQEIKESITKPQVSDGFIFSQVESLKASEFLKANENGNFSFWVQPPPDSKESIDKMFFPLKGFSTAYNKAIKLCKDNM